MAANPNPTPTRAGLALINGTQMMTAVGAEALHRADNVAMCADIAAALSVEVLKGTRRAFHSSIHSVRPHVGQGQVAKRLRTLLTPSSEVFMSHMYEGKVQDAYSLRCVPQVHGVVHDTIKFVGDTLTTEMNSVRWLVTVVTMAWGLFCGSGGFGGLLPAF